MVLSLRSDIETLMPNEFANQTAEAHFLDQSGCDVYTAVGKMAKLLGK
jgi:hypothetical protein